jgi:phasin family protein
MPDTFFDPKNIFEAYRSAFAPALKAQQEAIKAIDRLGRYQYAVAGDYLEWNLNHAKAVVSAQTPGELMSKQVEFATDLSEKLRGRAQEFATLTSDAQAGFSQVVTETTAKVAELSKEATAKAASAAKKATA